MRRLAYQTAIRCAAIDAAMEFLAGPPAINQIVTAYPNLAIGGIPLVSQDWLTECGRNRSQACALLLASRKDKCGAMVAYATCISRPNWEENFCQSLDDDGDYMLLSIAATGTARSDQ